MKANGHRRTLALAAGLACSGLGGAGAQVGQLLAPFLKEPALAGVKPDAAGTLTFPDGARVVLQSRSGYLTGATISVAPASGSGAARAAELTGLLSGFGPGLAEPLLSFLKRPEVAAKLPEGITVEADPFEITVKTVGGRLTVGLGLSRVPAADFAPTSHALPARKAAAVVLRVYSDFQCPYCERFETQTLPALLRALPDDVRVEFHQFPLESIHALARPAAEASECAGQQGKFWAYKDALFRDRSWLTGNAAGAFVALAADVGLKAGPFKTCLNTRGGKAAVDAGLAEARRLGLNGTPSVFVNGYAVPDPSNTAALLQLIRYARAVDAPRP
ncbi:DsbA family protein [Deinococcus aerophilus]|uniref:DsbA family protein n=1 Tax=Deinococcus aerophilus TaxID=522488 RepID=UPI001E28F216|nr:DsbA family protein [Deinococcus aerophilus]